MSRTSIAPRPEARAGKWTSVSAGMFEGICSVLSGEKFGPNIMAVVAAIQLFDLALEGYPLIYSPRSDVSLLVKQIMLDNFGITNSEKIVYYLVCWRNILDINREDPLSYALDNQTIEHVERMKSFFNALCQKGQIEHGARDTDIDDD